MRVKKGKNNGVQTQLDRLLCEHIAQLINLPVERWPGNCYGVALAMCERRVVDGVARYGLYLGKVASKTMFAGRPVVRHGWIESGDEIIDPTRYVFEGRPCYIYVGSRFDPNYDLGATTLRKKFRQPYSVCVKDGAPIVVPEEFRALLSMLVAEPIMIISLSQLFWFANLSPAELGVQCKDFYSWLQGIGHRVAVPLDFWGQVME